MSPACFRALTYSEPWSVALRSSTSKQSVRQYPADIQMQLHLPQRQTFSSGRTRFTPVAHMIQCCCRALVAFCRRRHTAGAGGLQSDTISVQSCCRSFPSWSCALTEDRSLFLRPPWQIGGPCSDRPVSAHGNRKCWCRCRAVWAPWAAGAVGVDRCGACLASPQQASACTLHWRRRLCCDTATQAPVNACLFIRRRCFTGRTCRCASLSEGRFHMSTASSDDSRSDAYPHCHAQA